MIRLLAILFVLALLAGCAAEPIVRTEYQRVEVPVVVRATPPAELTAPISIPAGLIFVSPDDPRASSALTPNGEDALVELINEYHARIRAWRAWAEKD